MIKNVFEINEIRNLIFSYLRKHPKKTCIHCNKVCVWDKEVASYVQTNVEKSTFNYVLCEECYDLFSSQMYCNVT